MIRQHQRQHRLGHRHQARQHRRVVTPVDLDRRRLPLLVDCLLRLRDRRRWLGSQAQHNLFAGADAAIGSRYVPGGDCVEWPRLRRFLSRWGNRYAAGMLGLAVNDATSGYRAYSAEVLRRMDVASVRADGYGFQVEMTHRLVRAGGRVVEIPIIFRDRERGTSKLSYRIIGEAFRLVMHLAVHDLRRGHRRRL